MFCTAVSKLRRPFGPIPSFRGDGAELIAWFTQQGDSRYLARARIYAGDWEDPDADPEQMCTGEMMRHMHINRSVSGGSSE